MQLLKITAAGMAASLLITGTAQASSTRASGMPVAPIAAKKLIRTSAPVSSKNKAVPTSAMILMGIAGAGALGTGLYFAVRDSSTGS